MLNKSYFNWFHKVQFFIACFDNLFVSNVRGVVDVLSFFAPTTLFNVGRHFLIVPPYHLAWVANFVDDWAIESVIIKLHATSSSFWWSCAKSVSDCPCFLQKTTLFETNANSGTVANLFAWDLGRSVCNSSSTVRISLIRKAPRKFSSFYKLSKPARNTRPISSAPECAHSLTVSKLQ